MDTSTHAQAIAYVEQLDLPAAPAQFLEANAAPLEFSTGPEVVAIGAQLTDFCAAVAPEQRAVVADCLLLAQLAANKATAMNDNLQAWYDQYLQVLQKLGWLETAMEFKAMHVDDVNADVHKAIIPVLTALLGPAAAAASMVVGVLQGLQQMDAHSPWITLFDRSSSHASGAKFQLGFVSAGDGMVTVQLAALAIDARRRITQVLFFKLGREDARLAVAKGELSISAERLQGIRQAVADRVAPHLIDNIGKIEL